MPRFNNVELTPETIAATRQYFANLARECIAAAISGEERPHNLPRYIAWKEEDARAALAGERDHSFTFLQHAYFLQTGESIALLP